MKLSASKNTKRVCKNKLKKALAKLRNSALSGNEEAAELLEELEDMRLEVVFAGGFSAGKSALINALIGEAFLESKAVPTTAQAIRIRHGSSLRLRIDYKNGLKQKISAPHKDERQLADLIQKMLDSASAQDAVFAYQLQLPLRGLERLSGKKAKRSYDSFEIVDAPGNNSGMESHERVLDSLPSRPDILIYVLNAQQILSSQDLSALKEWKKTGGIVFVLVNKIDIIDEDEQNLEELLDYCRKGIRSKAKIDDFFLFPVSAKYAGEASELCPGNRVRDFVRDFSFFAVEEGEFLLNRKKLEKIKDVFPALLDELGLSEDRKDASRFSYNTVVAWRQFVRPALRVLVSLALPPIVALAYFFGSPSPMSDATWKIQKAALLLPLSEGMEKSGFSLGGLSDQLAATGKRHLASTAKNPINDVAVYRRAFLAFQEGYHRSAGKYFSGLSAKRPLDWGPAANAFFLAGPTSFYLPAYSRLWFAALFLGMLLLHYFARKIQKFTVFPGFWNNLVFISYFIYTSILAFFCLFLIEAQHVLPEVWLRLFFWAWAGRIVYLLLHSRTEEPLDSGRPKSAAQELGSSPKPQSSGKNKVRLDNGSSGLEDEKEDWDEDEERD